jgi:plasmid stabilization system protein ParE
MPQGHQAFEFQNETLPKIRYTRRALRHMTEVLEYIVARSPSGAENVKRRLQGIIDLLADHPNSGRTVNKGISATSW